MKAYELQGNFGGRISLIGILYGGEPVDPLPVTHERRVRSRQMRRQPRDVGDHEQRLGSSQTPTNRGQGVFACTTPEALRPMESGSHFGKIVLRH